MSPRVILSLGIIGSLIGAAAAAVQSNSGAQPWGPTLAANMMLARLIPFVLALGVSVGVARALHAARAPSPETPARLAPGTIALHWITAIGVVLDLATGAWQYLKGVLDVSSPVLMATVYRLHYFGAMLILFASSAMLTYWWLRPDRPLLVPAGQRIRYLRGLAHELPRPFGATLAALVGLDMRRQPPPTGQFTYYQSMLSFPIWSALLGLVTITGLLKAMRYIYPIPGDVLWWSSTLHVAAMVMIGVKLLDHIRHALEPSRWPALKAMFTGRVSRSYLDRTHPAWASGSDPVSTAPTEAAP
ncbi:MAG: cytochrome b/b6 domain-containing protein [Chloroflexota bacterium]